MKPRQNYTPRIKSDFDLACEALKKRLKTLPTPKGWAVGYDLYGLDLPNFDIIEITPRPAVLVFRQASLFELAEVAA